MDGGFVASNQPVAVASPPVPVPPRSAAGVRRTHRAVVTTSAADKNSVRQFRRHAWHPTVPVGARHRTLRMGAAPTSGSAGRVRRAHRSLNVAVQLDGSLGNVALNGLSQSAYSRRRRPSHPRKPHRRARRARHPVGPRRGECGRIKGPAAFEPASQICRSGPTCQVVPLTS